MTNAAPCGSGSPRRRWRALYGDLAASAVDGRVSQLLARTVLGLSGSRPTTRSWPISSRPWPKHRAGALQDAVTAFLANTSR